jgi:hypothetical protein
MLFSLQKHCLQMKYLISDEGFESKDPTLGFSLIN